MGVARRLPVSVAISLLVTACNRNGAPVPTTAPLGAVEANATIEHVIDGDTVDVMIEGREQRVRLIGIDTPETGKSDTPDECFGPEATAFTASLLPVGTAVRIERDTVGRDDYGRLLGYLYRADDGIFVNYEIIRHGFARPLTIPPNTTHERLLVAAAHSADTDETGLWAACSD